MHLKLGSSSLEAEIREGQVVGKVFGKAFGKVFGKPFGKVSEKVFGT